MREFPDFLIIGVQKGGTTSLYDYLTHHPRIPRATRKEVRYFDENYERGLDWYRRQWPWWARFRPGAIIGEATPNYIFIPEVPARVHSTRPEVKLIVLLRDPISRAYSHYQMAVRREWETLDFAEGIGLEDERITDELGFIRFSYITRGFYADQLARWTRFFPLNHFLFLTSEELYADPRSIVHAALGFLGLESIELDAYRHRNRGRYEQKMSEETRAHLREIYRPHNERLYEMVGRDLGW